MSAADLTIDPGFRLVRVEAAQPPARTPVYDPRDGIETELAWLTDRIAKKEPVPVDLALKTFGTAVGVVYLTTVLLGIAGVRGPLAVSVAAVAAPIVVQVMRRRAK